MFTSRRLVQTAVAAAVSVAVAACGSAQKPASPLARNAAASPLAAPLSPTPSPRPAPAAPHPVDCRTARCVALTFDAGPGRDTAALLDILKAKRVNATFFLLGNDIQTRPQLVTREAMEGHEIGNHSWTHPRLTEVSDAEIRRELGRVQHRVKQLTGRTPTLMRPPQGRTDERVAAVSRSLGLAQILWTVTASDYRDHDPEIIKSRILDGAAPGGIILLHDIYPGTVPAVPGIIDGLRARGLTPVTVSQLFAPAEPQPGVAYWNAQ
ncbi:polysaccharide deacetylase family protein [Streptomyces sp. NBC_01465]|uniref:polysaccharide deacetylase family protein n=1 Tax=Streptomyces sp. NBC_01465 TaxID=2903878 RepID=UPI002E2ED53B|nr:polysaccharide deacetylase family protein [Streptomyces sp. NBC_01465]